MAAQPQGAEMRLNGIVDHLLNRVDRRYELKAPAGTITPANVTSWVAAAPSTLTPLIGAQITEFEYVVWFNDDTTDEFAEPAVGTENESVLRGAEFKVSASANPQYERIITVPGWRDSLTVLNEATGKKDLIDSSNADVQALIARFTETDFEFLDRNDTVADTVSTGVIRSTQSHRAGGGGRTG